MYKTDNPHGRFFGHRFWCDEQLSHQKRYAPALARARQRNPGEETHDEGNEQENYHMFKIHRQLLVEKG